MTKGKMINQFLRAFQKLKAHEDHYNIVAGPELKRVRFYLTNLYRSFCAYNRGEVPFYFVQINLDVWNDEGRPTLHRVLDDWHFRPAQMDLEEQIKHFYAPQTNEQYADDYVATVREAYGSLNTVQYEQVRKNAIAAALVAYMNEGGSIH